ncbi:MAG: formyltransferase family protein [Armatimonadota bacterium]|nr:formyltransferase family protein [Armatimonadota bacterium]MDR7423453.1 formyltransferase family protein [Armatimonadota bacterium]MDR7453254.1 formyltransferase family protein [Armatimonadota bacterium]MDR7458109.1 formyltransferase family protein [Armatimonadota bacterium]MDR7496616.1 formyltransferase family protein [Armatimonadota bacterium]
MRLVVATTTDDPLAAVFWSAYATAGGPAPAAVFLVRPRRVRPAWRRAVEGLLIFGVADSLRSVRLARRTASALAGAPERVLAGASAIHRVATLNRGEGLAALERAAPDLLVSAGLPEILKPHVLRLPAIGAVNVHNGRLPAYRGLFGTFWEAVHGEEWGYASVHVMAPEVDAGPVLAQGAVRLAGRGLLDALVAKKQQGGRLLAWLVRHVEREGALPAPRPAAQDTAGAYYGWPTLRDAGRFALRRVRGRRAPALAGSAPALWPSGVAYAEDRRS